MQFLSRLKSKAPAVVCPKPTGLDLLAEAVNEADEAALGAGVEVEAISHVLVEASPHSI